MSSSIVFTAPLLVLATVAALTGAQQFACPHDYGFYAHDIACDKYWACDLGVATLKTCGNGLAFDDTDPENLKENCDYLHNVKCGKRTELQINTNFSAGIASDKTEDKRNISSDSKGKQRLRSESLIRKHHQPEEFQCPQADGFFPHPEQCDAYWKCLNWIPQLRLCGNGLAFDTSHNNVNREHCNYVFAVDCGERVQLEPPIVVCKCKALKLTLFSKS
ncbi:protein obstructor-E isoform X2 [Hyalella azteca]|uniref:Protein obstructor-E isoform X2 n=1 Tax=Hyalella azteca TaxID=294128 RepID=A0A979FHZ4_HYAAZ|nr:protein obstructor-E isoform X2 [Hyalella azteca]